MSRRPSEVSQAVLAWALTDPGTVGRYRQMIEVVPGWTCHWFTGALYRAEGMDGFGWPRLTAGT